MDHLKPLCAPEDGDYMELVDEGSPDGMVQVCSADGVPRILMRRVDYDAIMKGNPDMTIGKEHVSSYDKLKQLMDEDEDLRTVRPGALDRFVDLLLLRREELAVPEPPKQSISWYFWNPNKSSAQAKEALIEALPELLECWLAVQEKKP